MGRLADPQRRRASPGCTARSGRRRRPRRRRRPGRARRPGPDTKAIIGHLPSRSRSPAPRRSGPGLPRARRGRWPGRARRRRRPGGGGASSRRMRVTMAVTWALSARPLPVTAAFISLGVCRATGTPAPGRRDDRDRTGLGGAHHGADVVLAEDPLDGDGVRLVLGDPGRRPPPRWRAAARRCRRPARCRTTPTATRVSGRPAAPSTTPSPQRVRPGSTPSTRTVVPPASEHLFGRNATGGPAPTTRAPTRHAVRRPRQRGLTRMRRVNVG